MQNRGCAMSKKRQTQPSASAGGCRSGPREISSVKRLIEENFSTRFDFVEK